MTRIYPNGKTLEIGLTVDDTDPRIDAAVAAVRRYRRVRIAAPSRDGLAHSYEGIATISAARTGRLLGTFACWLRS